MLGLWLEQRLFYYHLYGASLSFFCDVIDEMMNLSEIGCLAWQHWYKMADQFDYIKLDAFIAMPNHVHMIIIIDKPDDGRQTAMYRIPDGAANDEKNQRGGCAGDKNPMLHKNISRVVRWYKGVITFYARKMNPDFAWQC